MFSYTMNPLKRMCLALSIMVLTAPLAHGQRDGSEAASWLRWSPSHRDSYVVGYLEGYYRGFSLGCEAAVSDQAVPLESGAGNLPLDKCMNKKLNFTEWLELPKEITALYERYPENRNLYIKEILEELGKGRTINEIHYHPPVPAVRLTKQQRRGNGKD